MPGNLRILQVDFADDPLAKLADHILADAGPELPLLDEPLVLLPERESAPRLRRLLLERAGELGFEALLGPRVQLLSDWLAGFPIPGRRILDEPSRELMLVEALRQHRHLFGQANLWALADSLLELFEGMTRRRVGLPPDLAAFTRRLHRAYGCKEGTPAALGREARLVHGLWHAWHEQLAAHGCIDSATAWLLRLRASVDANEGGPLYLAGFPSLESPEVEWVEALARQRPVTLLIQGGGSETARIHPDTLPSELLRRFDAAPQANTPDPYGRFLSGVYEGYRDAPPAMWSRARRLAAELPESPAAGRLALFGADGAEEEARAVELQVRRWLLQGHRRIAVVTENRRLARRVRALLERAGIEVQDRGGWALSTTRAAAFLERWLECIEEDFPYLALLDLLKSPFLVPETDRARHLAVVFRLERDIILHENVARGLAAYRRHLEYRRHRLPEGLHAELRAVESLLQRLHHAAEPLRGAVGAEASPASTLRGLRISLERLGALPLLEEDPAGARLLQTLDALQRAAAESSIKLDWTELRTWIGSRLESTHFRPAVTGSPVLLIDLAQSALGSYDALIVAGAERDHLPGGGGQSPFFNDSVRRELGLPGSDEQQCERFYHFRRLLEAAPRVLVTFRREQDGEEVAASPWVESLAAFHRLGWGHGLEASELATLVRLPESEVVNRDAPLPPPTERPAPSAEPALLPKRLSPSAYQQLMDCPYQFFAARILRLAPPDALREALEKSDFGERVHRCLEAFHAGVEGLPGPFGPPVSLQNRERAIATLETIAEAVFAEDLEDNFLHRGWLERWRHIIPDYVDWQIGRGDRWRFAAAEVQAHHETPAYTLEGRLDRLDDSGESLAVLDYKTGRVPEEQEVRSGEAVQLPCYALLAEAETGRPVSRVEYLELGREGVRSRVALEDGELEVLAKGVGDRLSSLLEALHNGADMPAWGDPRSCSYCSMDGLCRMQVTGQ